MIAILAAISIVAYNGIRDRANNSVALADTTNATKLIKMFYSEYGAYPTALECPEITGTSVCVKPSTGTVFTYSANNTATPPTYSLVSTTPVTVTNLVKNGDFSGGLSNWTNQSTSPSTVTANGTATLIAQNGTRSVILQELATGYTDQDKVYYSLKAKRVSGADFLAYAARGTGGYNTNIVSTATYNAMPANGSLQRYSVVRPFVASQGATTSITIGQYATTSVFVAEVDDVVAINLTKDFGAGNEPTASQMDGMLATLPNGWFDGTTTVYK